jgi:nitrite reductase/ring-hydroxylating ferredoxin subunit
MTLRSSALRVLCHLEDIPNHGTRAFPAPTRAHAGLFAIRQGERVMIYVNACPHLGVPLDWAPGSFLASDGTRIVCATHGAEFEIDTGHCQRGPCKGDSLESVPYTLENGMIAVSSAAGL